MVGDSVKWGKNLVLTILIPSTLDPQVGIPNKINAWAEPHLLLQLVDIFGATACRRICLAFSSVCVKLPLFCNVFADNALIFIGVLPLPCSVMTKRQTIAWKLLVQVKLCWSCGHHFQLKLAVVDRETEEWVEGCDCSICRGILLETPT